MTCFVANKGRLAVSPCRTLLMFSRLAGAIAALWLCGAGAAWAGDGADLASLNQLLTTPTTGLCAVLKMASCPQLPTITQAMLEVAGLGNSPPEMLGAQNNIAPGSNVIAGNPAAVPVPPNNSGVPFPLNSTTTPQLLNPTTVESGQTQVIVPGLLTTLAPLAFVSQKSGTAVATQLYNPKADTFLYAVGVSSFGDTGVGGLTNADTAYFFYDDLFRVAQTFTKGQTVAKFSYPLTVLNSDGSENPAALITLEVQATCNGLPTPTCFQASVYGGGIGTASNPTPASKLGIQFALVFGASPTSTQKHAIFEVAVPLLVTGACVGDPVLCVPGQPRANTDPPYFYSAITGNPGNDSTVLPFTSGNFQIYTAFGNAGDDLGAPLPAPAYSIGLAPSAAPFCTPTTCPLGNLPPPGSVTFALCAALPDNTNGPAARLRPAVGAYYAIATDGEIFLGAPLAPVVASVCPAL
jgi:hypothetical protein